MPLKFFSDEELACPTTGQLALAPGFGVALDNVRQEFGLPMRINSGCRSAEHNAKVGGHPTSLHLIGNPKWGTDTCAVDVHIPDGQYRGVLMGVAWRYGFSLGIAKTFLHLDLRSRYTSLPQTTYLY